MPYRICLLTYQNLYDSKRVFSAGLAEALIKKGVEAIVLDFQNTSTTAKSISQEIVDFHPDLIISFNSIAQNSKGEFLWEAMKIPTLFAIVDPVIYYSNIRPSPYSLLSCVDRNDVNVLIENGYTKVFFWPHATTRDTTQEVERIFDVVFTGSCYDYESLREYWQANLPIKQQEVLDYAAEKILGKGCISIMQALTDAWAESQMDPTGVDFFNLFYYLDYYTRGKDRIELVKACKNEQVHVFGALGVDHPSAKNSWSYYLKGLSNITVHQPLMFNEALKIQKKSKICLNSMPFFKNGSHERILTPLAAGSVPVTTDSIWTREEFVDGEDLLIYTPGEYEGIGERVSKLIKDEPLRQSIAAKGKEKVEKYHTWDNRAQQLLDVLPTFLNK